MAQRTVGRILAGVTLAATIALAGSAPAHAAPRMPVVSPLSWLESFLGGRIAALWAGAAGGRGQAHGTEKAGPAIDPNGNTGSSQPTGNSVPGVQSSSPDPQG